MFHKPKYPQLITPLNTQPDNFLKRLRLRGHYSSVPEPVNTTITENTSHSGNFDFESLKPKQQGRLLPQDSSQRWIITSPLAEGKSVRSCTSKILGTPKDNEHLTLGVDCPNYPKATKRCRHKARR